MRKSLTKHVTYILFVILMTNISVWGFSGARLTHELEHAGKMALASSGHEHVHASHAGDAIDHDDDASTVVEHHVLHAVDHIQFFPDTDTHRDLAPNVASLVPAHFAEQSLPLSTFDPPFRPPRSGNLPA